jgi:hypothetical protein
MMKTTPAVWVVAVQTFILANASPGVQTIAIDRIPTYGTLRFANGSVTGVDFATQRVVAIILVEYMRCYGCLDNQYTLT